MGKLKISSFICRRRIIFTLEQFKHVYTRNISLRLDRSQLIRYSLDRVRIFSEQTQFPRNLTGDKITQHKLCSNSMAEYYNNYERILTKIKNSLSRRPGALRYSNCKNRV